MIGAHDRPQRRAQPGGDVILPVPLVDEDEGDVRSGGAHFLDVLGGIGVDDAKGDVGVPLGDRLDRSRNDADEQRGNGGYPDLALDIAGYRGDLQARAPPFGERVAGMAQQLLAGRRQPHPVAASLEDGNANFRPRASGSRD